MMYGIFKFNLICPDLYCMLVSHRRYRIRVPLFKEVRYLHYFQEVHYSSSAVVKCAMAILTSEWYWARFISSHYVFVDGNCRISSSLLSASSRYLRQLLAESQFRSEGRKFSILCTVAFLYVPRYVTVCC
jgi:hypothetical protein